MNEDEKEWLDLNQEVLVELKVPTDILNQLKCAAALAGVSVEDYVKDIIMKTDRDGST